MKKKRAALTRAIKDAALRAAATVTVDEVKSRVCSPVPVAMSCGFATGVLVYVLMSRESDT